MAHTWQSQAIRTGAALFFGFLSAHAALLVDGFSAAINDRFTNDPSFIAAQLDLSGLARSSSNRWGTLISPNLALSAHHFYPANGSTLSFFSTNDPSGPTEVREVIGSVRIGTSDLRICVLDEALPAIYQPMDVVEQPIEDGSAFEGSFLDGLSVYMIGRSDDVDTSVTNVAVGANRLEGWFDSVSAAGTTDDALGAIQHLSGDDEFVPFEAFLQVFDSGAPVLVDDNGIPTIIGINWFVGQVDIHPSPTQGIRNVSGFSYVGNYAAQINAIIDAFAVDATVGYLAWMSGAFGAESDWARIGPAADFDRDGVINLLEYAFVLDPLSGSESCIGIPGVAELPGGRFLELTFSAHADTELQFAVRTGSALSGWTEVALEFNGSTWNSGDPSLVEIGQATDTGGGVWLLSVRAANPLETGTPAFLVLVAR
jgi:hypothetical protein